jgi:hypothetical protein
LAVVALAVLLLQIQLLVGQVVKTLFLVLSPQQAVAVVAHGELALTLKLAALVAVLLNQVQELLAHRVFLVKVMLVVRLEMQTLEAVGVAQERLV